MYDEEQKPEMKYNVTYDIYDKNLEIIGCHTSRVAANSAKEAYIKSEQTGKKVSDIDKTYMPLKITENDMVKVNFFEMLF